MKTAVRFTAALFTGLLALASSALDQHLFTGYYYEPDGSWHSADDGRITPAGGGIISDSAADPGVLFEAQSPAGCRVQHWFMVKTSEAGADGLQPGATIEYLGPYSESLPVSWNNNHKFNTSPVYVCARFYYITNSVVFHKGATDATGSTASVGYQCYTNSYALTPNGFSRTGYTFLNWTNDAGVVYVDGQAVSGSDLGVTNNMQVVNLYAEWSPNAYIVTFDANGGSTPTASKSVTYDSAYGTLPTPTWTGHTFEGWYTEATGGSRRYEDTKVSITSNETLHAHWNVITHRLTTAVSGGGYVSPGSQNYGYGTVVDVTATPLTGWLFKGWQEDASAENPRSVTVTYDITLTAVFTQKVYAVTFQYRNASGKLVSTEPQYVNYGGSATAPSQELYNSYPGHVFTYWNDSYENVTRTKTVVAQYEANQYTVEYNPNCDDSTGTMQSQIKSCGEEWNLRENKFARAGYTFGGWNAEPDGSGNPYSDKEAVSDLSLIDGDTVTLYAQWAPITYSIEFNGGTGSSGSMAPVSGVEYGAEVVLPANRFTKPGCEFQGWKCSEIFFADGATVSNLTTTAGATVTLVATWDAPYWIAFDANGGVGDMAVQRFEIDEAKALSSNEFTRTGYTFEGWATNAAEAAALVVKYGDGAVVCNLVSEVGVTNSLFASWRPISYVTAFDASKHSSVAIAPSNCIYDVAFPLPVIPYGAGELWKHVGWSNTLANVVYYTSEVTTVSNLCSLAGATNTLVAVWESMVGPLSEAMDIYNLAWANSAAGSWHVVAGGHGTPTCVAQEVPKSVSKMWVMTSAVTNSGTLSFWWKTSAGVASLEYNSTQGSATSITTETFSASTTWTKVSIRVEILPPPESSTRTIFLSPKKSGADDTVYIDQMTWTPDGSSVEPTPADARDISGITFDGSGLTLSFTNADERFSYNLRGTNDLVAPLALWPVLWTTNGTGTITITPPLAPSEPQFFYYLETTAK